MLWQRLPMLGRLHGLNARPASTQPDLSRPASRRYSTGDGCLIWHWCSYWHGRAQSEAELPVSVGAGEEGQQDTPANPATNALEAAKATWASTHEDGAVQDHSGTNGVVQDHSGTNGHAAKPASG